MSIMPLDLQVLYAQQNNVSRIQHARIIEKDLLLQAEDSKVKQDSYEHDSKVVKTQKKAEEQKVDEREDREEQRHRRFKFVHYRKKKSGSDEGEVYGEEYEGYYDGGKGRRIDILQ